MCVRIIVRCRTQLVPMVLPLIQLSSGQLSLLWSCLLGSRKSYILPVMYRNYAAFILQLLNCDVLQL